MTLRLYDLAGAEPDRRFSPYCWRIRLALAHKGLAVTTIPWRFTEKGRLVSLLQPRTAGLSTRSSRAISPENPDYTLSTAEKNALTFELLSDIDQKVGRAFRLVYEFSDELKCAYKGFDQEWLRQ